jgi:hypothetical protein
VLLLDGLFQISTVFFCAKLGKKFKIKNKKLVAYWLLYGKNIGTSPCKFFFPHCIFIWILV